MRDGDDEKKKMEDITKLIPHRPPFLFVDRVVELSPNQIRTVKCFLPQESFFAGHYPGNPLVPGVILCEAIFQSGAILIASQIISLESGTPVLTRVKNAAFKRMVRPGEELDIQVSLADRIQNAIFLKGSARVNEQLAVRVEFTCALVKA